MMTTSLGLTTVAIFFLLLLCAIFEEPVGTIGTFLIIMGALAFAPSSDRIVEVAIKKEVVYEAKVYQIDSVYILTTDSILINVENFEYR